MRNGLVGFEIWIHHFQRDPDHYIRPLNKSSEILIDNRMENLNLYCKMLDFHRASKNTVNSINSGHFLPFLTQNCKNRKNYSRFRSTKYKWLWIRSDPDRQQLLMLC
jgi:hypothetical protein